MKKTSLAVLLGLVVTPGLAVANDGYSYTCRHSHEQRRIEVIYLQRESRVPCEVRYIKKNSDERLWKANYEIGYCESKASEFVQKQEGWGWICSMDEQPGDDSLPKDGREDELTG